LGLADRIRHLGDFTTSPRVLVISGIAIVVVNTATIASIMLLDLIRLCTSLTYFGRFSLSYLQLGKSPLGVAAVVWLLLLAS
jgi:chloride channel protein, CIC family